MTPSEFGRRASAFRKHLDKVKAGVPAADFGWYRYNVLNQYPLIQRLIESSAIPVDRLTGPGRVADIGCADGDFAFFLESLGCRVDAIDFAETNENGLRGAWALKRALNSSVEIHAMDLDIGFRLPAENYGLALFLGILYHLKNPYYALETLAAQTRWCLLSTRVARYAPDHSVPIRSLPVAYLLDERETNNDPTNYWIFSEAGLGRLLSRTGWSICACTWNGDTENSDPVRPGADERMFFLLESRQAAGFGAGVDLTAGWHAPEPGGWRWTERRFAAVAHPRAGSGPPVVRLGVTVPESSIATLGAITLRCSANGVALAPETFDSGGSFTYSRSLPKVSSGEPLSLAFELDRAIEPGLDIRELGIVVSSVAID